LTARVVVYVVDHAADRDQPLGGVVGEAGEAVAIGEAARGDGAVGGVTGGGEA
jgi:hypothetical protein